jgi:hypothetical protein
MLMGLRARMVGLAAMLPPGIERTSKPSAPMSAFGGPLLIQSGHWGGCKGGERSVGRVTSDRLSQ